MARQFLESSQCPLKPKKTTPPQETPHLNKLTNCIVIHGCIALASSSTRLHQPLPRNSSAKKGNRLIKGSAGMKVCLVRMILAVTEVAHQAPYACTASKYQGLLAKTRHDLGRCTLLVQLCTEPQNARP